MNIDNLFAWICEKSTLFHNWIKSDFFSGFVSSILLKASAKGLSTKVILIGSLIQSMNLSFRKKIEWKIGSLLIACTIRRVGDVI